MNGRRARPTIRCLIEDLHRELPDIDVDLGDIDDSMLEEARRVAPTSPLGQRRILSITDRMVYRIRHSEMRAPLGSMKNLRSFGCWRSNVAKRTLWMTLTNISVGFINKANCFRLKTTACVIEPKRLDVSLQVYGWRLLRFSNRLVHGRGSNVSSSLAIRLKSRSSLPRRQMSKRSG